MGKYMKYEIKGSYKVILGILAIVLIATTVLYTYIAKQENSPIMGIVSMILFGSFLAATLYILGSFRKELYEDRGYLTFTLPLTGNQILGAKLLVALIWFVLLGVVTLGYNIFMMAKMWEDMIGYKELSSMIKELLSVINIGEVLALVTMAFITGIVTLILIYFSMTLSRVTLGNKKIGGMWFIIFLVLSSLMIYIQIKVVKLSPYYLNLKDWSIINTNITRLFEFEFNGSSLMVNGGDYSYVNIASFVVSIVTGIVLFLGTGHIIEKKIDL